MMSCDTVQFSDMGAENKAVRCVLKFKVTTKGIWNISEDSEDMSRKVNSGKRKPEASLDVQRWKNQKMDLSKDKSCGGTEGHRHRVSMGGSKPREGKISVKQLKTAMDRGTKLECSKILKDLMIHRYGWVFSEPVDPVKLMIPDYFTIVKKPMDLGTIKHRLEGNMYSNAKEFADDVKLTFENAKMYNPPSHDVHLWAETLDANFSRRWKLLDTRLKLAKNNDEGAAVGVTETSTPVKLGNTRRIAPEEREKSKLGTMQIKTEKTALNGCSSLIKTAEKVAEHCSRHTSSSANLRQSIDSTKAKCSSCVSSTCCCPKNCTVQTSASDISSERSSGHNRYGDSKLDREVKCTLASLANNFALDSEGHVERSPHSTPPVSDEGWMAEVKLSPRKALRAAKLKSRFADTIFRATHLTQAAHGDKSDLSSMQQEKLRLEKEQLKEKARIEAQIKAAEAASRRKEQDELMMRREMERKAARMALEKMEKTVDIDRAAGILKELEILVGLPVQGGYPNAKALEQLGLVMKDKYLEEDEDATLNVEEGEILS